MNWVFELLISLWPAVVFVALVMSVLLPDRYRPRPTDGPDVGLAVSTAMWLVAIFWWVPAYMTQHGAANLNVPGFWPAVLQMLRTERAWLHAGLMPVILGGYFAVGLVWAVVYFWVYARRMGHLYVAERDAWLARAGVASLDSLSAEQKLKFRTVLETVKRQMLYRGEFPLRPFQQKRFFTANLVLWPLTLACYLVGDLVVDIARSVWFALRNWIHAQWRAGMAEYLEDELTCCEYDASLAAAKGAKEADAHGMDKAGTITGRCT